MLQHGHSSLPKTSGSNDYVVDWLHATRLSNLLTGYSQGQLATHLRQHRLGTRGRAGGRTQRSTHFIHSSHMICVAVERAHDEDHLDKESDKPKHSEAQRRLSADLGELCVSALTVEAYNH
jgi:hypothetical protein